MPVKFELPLGKARCYPSISSEAMALIRCTQKVLAEMGITVSALGEIDDPLEQLALWYCNVIHLSSKKTLIFTNPATCFSLVLPGVKRAEIKTLPNVFINTLVFALRDEGVRDEVIDSIAFLFETTRISKTKDRRPLCVMNDLAKHIPAHLAFDYGGDPARFDGRLLKKLNRILWSGLKFYTAIEHLGRVLQERYGWEGRFGR